jgi:uncharacterized membrane protein
MNQKSVTPIASGTRWSGSATDTRLPASLASKLNAQSAVWLLACILVVYVAFYSVTSSYKFLTFRQGFDLAQNEQTIWNTTQGRWFQTSPFVNLEYDFDDGIVPFELLLAVPYALFPNTLTLLFLQSVALAAGAIPLFLLAREKLSVWIALAIACAYLFHVTVTRMNMYEFQLRSFVLPFFLFAFYFFEKNRFGLFWLFALLMLSCKTEVALTLPMFGVYAWMTGKPLKWIWTPVAVGLGYFAFVFGVIMPRFAPRDLIGGAYGYSWLGNNFGEMLVTILTKPLFVLQNVLIPGKINYLFESFFLLLFLPLLKPRLLVFALPSLALNLLAVRSVQFSVLYFYQPFIISTFFLATIYGLGDTIPRWFGEKAPRVQGLIALALLVASIGFNLTWNNLALRAWRQPEPVERRQAAARVLSQIPSDAAVAASSFLGPHLAQRRELYFFPGTNSYPYSIELADYVVGDLRLDRGETAQQALAQLAADPAWELVARDTDYVLYRRRNL